MHNDPSVYENPSEFMPERWLGDIDPNMMRNFTPFTRGLVYQLRLPNYMLIAFRFSELYWPELGAGGVKSGARCAISPRLRKAGVV
jgi:hypothetical protein